MMQHILHYLCGFCFTAADFVDRSAAAFLLYHSSFSIVAADGCSWPSYRGVMGEVSVYKTGVWYIG